MVKDICQEACPLNPCRLAEVMGEISWLYLSSQDSAEMESVWTSLEKKWEFVVKSLKMCFLESIRKEEMSMTRRKSDQ